MPEIDNTLTLISRLRFKTHRLLTEALDKAGFKGFLPVHGEILMHLARNQPNGLSMKHIARLIDRDKATVTSLIKHLEKAELVNRQRDQEDTRKVLVKAKAKARKLQGQMLAISGKVTESLYQGFNAKEKKDFKALVTKAIKNL